MVAVLLLIEQILSSRAPSEQKEAVADLRHGAVSRSTKGKEETPEGIRNAGEFAALPETIGARNFVRMIAAGSALMVITVAASPNSLKLWLKVKAPGYKIKTNKNCCN
jgi:hypothetical protein